MQNSDTESAFHAYHVLTHTLMTSLRKRLAGMTTKAFVNEFVANVAVEVSRCLVGDSKAPMLKMLSILSSSGFSVDLVAEENSTYWNISCPFAHSVHPEIPHDSTCPVALLLLGSIKIRNIDEELQDSNLTEEGVEFRTRTIEAHTEVATKINATMA